MELAVRMNATLYFFTTVPDHQQDDKYILRHVYHSLLVARGNYLQYYAAPTKGTAIAKTERLIEKGDLTWSLIKFVKKTNFDIVVVDPNASGLTAATIHDVVENSKGVIVLPDQKEIPDDLANRTAKEIGKNPSDHFFEVLRQSDCYQLHSNFFRILGQDKRLFNYLRCFFRKKEYRNT